MVTNKSPNPEAVAKARELIARRHELLEKLQEVNEQLGRILPPGQLRDLSIDMSGLRGSVSYHGDIISPTGERWDAEQ